MTDLWLPPAGVRRTSDVITVSAGMFKSSEFRCPAADALKARSYVPIQRDNPPREQLEGFAFGPFMAACDDRARRSDDEGGLPRGRAKPMHDGLRRWTKHALAMYEAAFSAEGEGHGERMIEISAPWVYRYQPRAPDPRGGSEYRFTVWGRCLTSADGKTRELRLPVNRLYRESPSDKFVAAAALVLAEGGSGIEPDRLKIVEVALLNGKVRSLFDDTRAEALALYREHGRDALASLLDSREYRPGASCADCSYLTVCPALRRSHGLLGVEAQGLPRRSWSVTNGRNYQICPARDLMRRLHLPTADAVERGTAAERGRAIHAYLAARHGNGDLRPCTADVAEQWVPDGFELPESERALGARLLRHHAAVCPLRLVDDGADVRNEPRVVRHDSAADVIVVAAPDLIYRDGDSWVWRETKTSAREQRSSAQLLDRYPQLALAVLFFARGDLGGASGLARIELEVLRPDGADLEIIDPGVPATLEAAARIIHELVAKWRRDDDYGAVPGKACARCETEHWCSASVAGMCA